MKLTSNEILLKLKKINLEVKKSMKKQGFVPPIKGSNGSISVGSYRILKHANYYEIRGYDNQIIVSNINLPQTAAMLANSLALNHIYDNKIYVQDQLYGHAMFEEQLHKKIAAKRLFKKSWDSYDIIKNKESISSLKKEYYKNVIVQGFEKLIRFR